MTYSIYAYNNMDDQNQNPQTETPQQSVNDSTVVQPVEATPEAIQSQGSITQGNSANANPQVIQPQSPDEAYPSTNNGQVITDGSVNPPGQGVPSNKTSGRSRLFKRSLITVVVILLIGCIGAYAYNHIKSGTVVCGSESCLNQKFASCSPATYNSPVTEQVAVKYHIYGKQGTGCNMQFEYTANPSKDWVNKPLTCDFDNSKSLGNAVLAALSNPAAYKCNGPLVSQIEISNSNQSLNNNVSSNNVSQNADNTKRQQDASIILSAINEYISNNNGALPRTASQGSTSHTLLLCSGTCTSSNSSTANLGFYSSSKVSFHAYTSNLTVPDNETVYIVNQATCTNDSTIGTQATSGISTVVLYAAQDSSSIKQQCQAS
jgi:hypothetical protein